jgi:DNA repair exonuclease SbcCD nuclease subunit
VSGSLRFVHAADLHLDAPFRGVAATAPVVAQALYEASLQAWDAVVELTIAREAALLVIAGDIYDGSERGVRAQLRFLAGLRRLSDAGVRTFIVHGNHDPLDGWSAIKEFPSGVTVFGHEAVESVTVKVGGQTVHVHGISYRTRDVRENLALGFKRARGAALNIGVLHANVGGQADHAPYSPCSLADLEAAGMHYWALGHIHKRQLLREGGPWVAYPGNTQGRSPKPSEAGPKGVLVVEATGSTIDSVAFEPVDAVRFVPCEVVVTGVVDVAALQEAVLDAVGRLRAEHEGSALLVRVMLAGRGPVAADLRREGAVAELRDALRDSFAGRTPFVWVEAVKNAARSPIDLGAVRGRGDFSAALLERFDDLAGGEGAAEDFVARASELLVRPGQVATALRDLETDDSADPGVLPVRADAGDVLAEALEVALGGLEAEADR